MTTNVSSFVKSFNNSWLPGFKAKAAITIDEANAQRRVDAELISPVDTGDYIEGHKIEKARTV